MLGDGVCVHRIKQIGVKNLKAWLRKGYKSGLGWSKKHHRETEGFFFFFLNFDTLRKFDFCYQEQNSIVVKAGLENCEDMHSYLGSTT